MAESKPEVLVIGLDGGTWDVIRPGIASGHLPALAGLAERGSCGTLWSTVPPITPAAWTSFATGQTPARHGIHTWAVLEPGSYVNHLVSRRDVAAQTFWELLDARGESAGIFNMPLAYPPVELEHGYVVAGFDAPAYAREICSPPGLGERLKKVAGKHCLGAHETRKSADGAVDIEFQEAQINARTDAAEWLIRTRPTRLCAVVYQATDHICHDCWGAREAKAIDGRDIDDIVLHVYKTVDAGIERLLAAAGPDCSVLVVSDHGFGPSRYAVDLNGMLERAGYLVRRAKRVDSHNLKVRLIRAARGLRRLLFSDSTWSRLAKHTRVRDMIRATQASAEVDWARTQAFSWATGGVIRLNLEGREPEGIVARDDYEKLRTEMCEVLPEMELPGTSVKPIRRVYRHEEIYPGESVGEPPDLIAEPDYDQGVILQYPQWERDAPLVQDCRGGTMGWHRPEGICIAAGPAFGRGGEHELHLQDVAPTLLHVLGQPIPRSMDGQVAEHLLSDAVRRRGAPLYSDDETSASGGVSGLDDDEEEQLAQRLRDLGYIE